MITTAMAVTHAAVTMATVSRARRLLRKTGVSAEIPAATINGTATASASN